MGQKRIYIPEYNASAMVDENIDEETLAALKEMCRIAYNNCEKMKLNTMSEINNDSWHAQLEQAARKYVSEIRGGELTPSDKEYFREKAAYIAGTMWRRESERERMIVLLEWMEKQFGISYIGRKSNSPEDVYKKFLQYEAEQKPKNKS